MYIEILLTFNFCYELCSHALSLDVLKSLKNAIEKKSDEKQPRVIIICSSGKVFSAGHDLRELVRG